MWLANVQHVYVASHRVDFRKSYDGLLAECYHLGLNPFNGDAVLFIGRCRRRMKLLFGDQTGLWLASKRFNDESLKTSFKFLLDPSVEEVSMAELQMFIEGTKYRIEKRLKKRDDISLI